MSCSSAAAKGLGGGPGGGHSNHPRGVGAVVGDGTGVGAEGTGDTGDGLRGVDGQLVQMGLVHDLIFHLFFPFKGQANLCAAVLWYVAAGDAALNVWNGG